MTAAEAAQALIQSFGPVPATAHAVWIQTRVHKQTGEAQSYLMCAINPKGPMAGRSLPDVFYGYRVEPHPWPDDPRQVLGQAL